jgi:hypothetical protein
MKYEVLKPKFIICARLNTTFTNCFCIPNAPIHPRRSGVPLSTVLPNRDKMLRRKPTRMDLCQADVDALDLIRRDRVAETQASEEASLVAPTRREAAIANMSDRERLGLPRVRLESSADSANQGRALE